MLEHEILPHLKQTLPLKFFLSDEEDTPLWGPSDTGNFTVKSAWNFWRSEENSHSRIKWIGHHTLPTKIQIFSWKAWKDIITVYAFIQRRIPLASRCCCCNHSAIEALNHLLIQGETAAAVWAHFGNVCGVRQGVNNSWWTRQGLWFQAADSNTQMGIVRGVLPALIVWEIWKARCAHRYEERRMSSSNIIRTINNDLLESMSKAKVKRHCNFSDLISLQVLRMVRHPLRTKRPILVRWTLPPPGSFKLNSDGSTLLSGLSGAGGIIRNHHGDMLLGYSIALGQGTNIAAKMYVLLHGFLHCKQQGWLPLIVEADAEILLNWYSCTHICPTKHRATWNIITQLEQGLHIRTTHIYREGNITADGLSKLGSSQQSTFFWTMATLPRNIRTSYFMDKLGMATIRQ